MRAEDIISIDAMRTIMADGIVHLHGYSIEERDDVVIVTFYANESLRLDPWEFGKDYYNSNLKSMFNAMSPKILNSVVK